MFNDYAVLKLAKERRRNPIRAGCTPAATSGELRAGWKRALEGILCFIDPCRSLRTVSPERRAALAGATGPAKDAPDWRMDPWQVDPDRSHVPQAGPADGARAERPIGRRYPCST